jgi:hypothetical protein
MASAFSTSAGVASSTFLSLRSGKISADEKGKKPFYPYYN